MTATDEANEVLAELSRKREKTVAHWEDLTAERSALAFAAHVEDDKAAKKRLDIIAADAFKIDGELATIDAAIRVAKERVEQAKAEEQRAEDREAARALRQAYQGFVKLADIADEHLRSFVAAAGELKRTVDAIHAIQSSAAPTGHQRHRS
jgi:hypothetical protein